MKRFLYFVSFFLAFSLGAGHADDMSDVQAVIDAIHAASNENNIDKLEQHHSSEATQFNGWGGNLRKRDWEESRDWVKDGGKWKVERGKIEIAIHGTTAIVTGYEKVEFFPPDDDEGWREDMGRYTWVLSSGKDGDGAWKVVHKHHSRGIFVSADSVK